MSSGQLAGGVTNRSRPGRTIPAGDSPRETMERGTQLQPRAFVARLGSAIACPAVRRTGELVLVAPEISKLGPYCSRSDVLVVASMFRRALPETNGLRYPPFGACSGAGAKAVT
jgi:hypothetical protein